MDVLVEYPQSLFLWFLVLRMGAVPFCKRYSEAILSERNRTGKTDANSNWKEVMRETHRYGKEVRETAIQAW